MGDQQIMTSTQSGQAKPPEADVSGEWLITHDFAHVMGGAERCTAAIAEILPGASAWVIGGSRQIVEEVFDGRQVKSVLPIGILSDTFERFMTPLLYPLVRLIRPSRKNIFASSYALAHLRRSRGIKIIYCHSPFRQIYSGVQDYFPKFPIGGRFLEFLLRPFRGLDRRAAKEADAVIATNSIVAARVKQYWGRPADGIIPPPIDTELFCPVDSPNRSYFLWVGRIVEPYKRLSLVLEAFAALPDEQLIVVGEGRDRDLLESRAPDNVQFAGKRYGTDLAQYYANAKAVIFPSADDFGMVPLEAMSAGTPVVGYSGGGARETIVDGVTGIAYRDSSTECLLRALEIFKETEWDTKAIREYALGFSHEAFAQRISEVIARTSDRKLQGIQTNRNDYVE